METTRRPIPNTPEARQAAQRVDGLREALTYVPAGTAAAHAIRMELANAEAIEAEYADDYAADQARRASNRDARRLTITRGRIA